MTGLLWYLAETGAALAVFYGVCRLALKNDSHFQACRLYLLASLVAAHVLPLVRVTSPFRRVVVPAGFLADLDATMASASGWSWQQALIWVYAAGAAFVFLRLAWHLWRLLRVARRHPVAYRDGVRVVYVDEDCPPFSFFRTAFVHRPTAGDEQALDQVVAHERTHIRQGHSLDIMLIQLAAIAQWFNPFIWLYKTALRELHEYLADREVLAQGFDPFTYRRILFEQHLGARSFEFAHHLRHSQIKRRLAMMTRRSGPWTVLTYLLALPAVGLLVLAFAEPQVLVAQGPKPAESAAVKADAKKAQADETKVVVIDKKKLEAEYKAKMESLKADHAAASDPETKKALEDKMLKLRQKYTQGMQSADLSDPVMVEKMLADLSKKLEQLETKRTEITDPVQLEKFQQELDNLSKKREVLKARLAELKGAR
jgi:hypothetical protein